LTQRVAFPDLGLVSVRTPASISPAAVAEAYHTASAAFAAYLNANGVHQPPASPVQTIVVVPRDALCLPSTYSGVAPPTSCAEAVHAFRIVDSTLVVVDVAQEWSKAMRLGVPEAACAAAGPESPLCALAPEFALTKE
jgi:hypothetical protein